VLVFLEGFGSGLLRVALRDLLALFLVLASVVLAVSFGLLLGSIRPGSSGRAVPLSAVQALARGQHVLSATLNRSGKVGGLIA
jgi:hypothetical protein